MKILVTYLSWTGNTQKVAEAIFQEIQLEKELKELKAVESLEGYDLVFVGTPVHGFGKLPPEIEEFLGKLGADKKIALFCTHGAPVDSAFVAEWREGWKTAASGVQLAGIFDCQGQIALEQVDLMLQSGDPQNLAIAKDVVHSSLHQPDEVQLERSREFARRMTAPFLAFEGEKLVRELFGQLAGGKIEDKVAPGFQSVHQDGARDRDTEIRLLSGLNMQDHKLSDFKVTQNGPVMLVTYTASMRETIDGKVAEGKPAPRLSVFIKQSQGWQWLAHANLIAIK